MSAPQLKRNFKYPPRLVNQHNLREQTRFRLYFPKDLEVKEMKTDLPAEDKREYILLTISFYLYILRTYILNIQ